MSNESLKGTKEKLRAISRGVNKPLAAGLYAAAQVILTRAKELAPLYDGPVQTMFKDGSKPLKFPRGPGGALRGSGYVADPEITQTAVSVQIGFGGPAAPYAVRQHETTGYRHEVGQAKYLESAVSELGPRVAQIVADEAERILKGGGGP